VLHLRTDQYTNISRDCPVHIDLHQVDDVVEVVLGEHRFDGNTLRLVVDHPDMCRRLAEALRDAGIRLTTHLHSKSDVDSALTATIAQ
jgi:hypothetical protein